MSSREFSLDERTAISHAFSVRIPEDMRTRAEKAAKVRGLKLSQIVKLALSDWLRKEGE